MSDFDQELRRLRLAEAVVKEIGRLWMSPSQLPESVVEACDAYFASTLSTPAAPATTICEACDAAIEQGRADFAAGRTTPLEEIRREMDAPEDEDAQIAREIDEARRDSINRACEEQERSIAASAHATGETCDCAQAEPLFVRALLRHWQSVGTNSAVEHEREAIFAWVLKHRKCPAVYAAIRQLERDTVAGLSTLDGHVPSSTPTPSGRVIAEGRVIHRNEHRGMALVSFGSNDVWIECDIKVGQPVAIVERGE